MKTENNNKPHKGIFSRFQSRLKRNRLGELLVLDGVLSPQQLKIALQKSKTDGKHLGDVLVANNLVSRSAIRRTLFEQYTLRVTAATLAIFISIASMGFAKQARAGQVEDVPTKISLVQQSFENASYYPKLFGSTEKRSTSLKAFTKWTDMFQRFNASLNTSTGKSEVTQLRNQLEDLKGLPLNKMAERVNSMMNSVRYVSDQANYGQTDYWATPVEFFKNGGDCEDYAISKYTALRVLGVPENRLRIAIVQDLQKNVPHAILIVYTDQGAIILDNQIKTTISAERVTHYKPIFSINQDAWWLHTAPRGNVTVVASSSR